MTGIFPPAGPTGVRVKSDGFCGAAHCTRGNGSKPGGCQMRCHTPSSHHHPAVLFPPHLRIRSFLSQFFIIISPKYSQCSLPLSSQYFFYHSIFAIRSLGISLTPPGSPTSHPCLLICMPEWVCLKKVVHQIYLLRGNHHHHHHHTSVPHPIQSFYSRQAVVFSVCLDKLPQREGRF